MSPSFISQALVSIALVAGFTTAHVLPRQAAPNGTLAWAPCDATVAPLTVKDAQLGLQCANMSVPIVHDKPDGEKTQLSLMRLPARGKRIGNLFINPGGPGAPASTQLVSFSEGGLPVGAAIFQSFDIVAMDPRGVGRSSPTICNTTLANQPSEFDVLNVDQLKQNIAFNKAMGEACKANMGSLFDNMDTIAVAKDLELVRVGKCSP